MNKLLLLLVLTSFFSSMSFANKNKGGKEAKLTYEEYINDYGKNDTCKAIIAIYFDKREYNANGKMSFLPVSAGVTVLVPPIGVALMGISTPLFVSGLITKTKYSYKNLNEDLTDYIEFGVISKKLRKKVKRYIEQENYMENEMLNTEDIALLQTIEKMGTK